MPVRKSHLLIAVAVVMGIFLVLQGSALAETLLERGTYLMRSIVACGTCHTPKDVKGDLPGMELAGGFRIKGPVFNVVIRNITPDKETGIGAWTDKQIIRAIQQGIRADGKIIGPPMPIEFYRDMSDRDVKAIVAYLRRVKPIRNEEEESVWKIPLPKSYGPPVGSVPEVPRTDKIRYGEYLVRIGRCLDCHTPLVKGHRDFKRQLGAGGFPLGGPWGLTFSANITQDKETGIGKWTDRQIKLAITNGQRANGEDVRADAVSLLRQLEAGGSGRHRGVSEDAQACQEKTGSAAYSAEEIKQHSI